MTREIIVRTPLVEVWRFTIPPAEKMPPITSGHMNTTVLVLEGDVRLEVDHGGTAEIIELKRRGFAVVPRGELGFVVAGGDGAEILEICFVGRPTAADQRAPA